MLSRLVKIIVSNAVQSQLDVENAEYSVDVDEADDKVDIYITVADQYKDDIDEMGILDAIASRADLANTDIDITIVGESERQDALEGALADVAGDDDEQLDDSEDFQVVEEEDLYIDEIDDNYDDLYEAEDIQDEYEEGALDRYEPTFKDVEDFYEGDDV